MRGDLEWGTIPGLVTSSVVRFGDREAVVDGETGLLVTPRSPAELARALLRLLGDPGEAARLGAKGLARVRALFGLPREIAETALAHAIGDSTVERAYLRTDLFDKRAQMMQDYADFVAPIADQEMTDAKQLTTV